MPDILNGGRLGKKEIKMLDPLDELIAAAPVAAQVFPDTEYPLPIQQALYGNAPSPEVLVARIRGAESVVAALEPVLALAEAVESVAADRLDYFLTDAKARNLVFMGAKWKAGWALLVGAGVTDELIQRLLQREFLVFCADAPDELVRRVQRVPARATGMIYFLQLAVRYGMIWGRIPPGESHELGHFLEDDVPGVVVAVGDLRPLESLLILGLMKMGIPAIVPTGYPYQQGVQVTADSIDEILREIGRFPNLRVKEVDGRELRLPSYANPAHAGEKFEPVRSLSGANSFLVVRPDPTVRDGDIIVGQPAEVDGEIGIEVGLADGKASDGVCEWLEERSRAALKQLKGVRPAANKPGTSSLQLEFSAEATAGPEQLAEVIRRSLQFDYPRLGGVSVRVTFDQVELSAKAPQVFRQQLERRSRVAAMSANDSPIFTCTDCQPFSQEHVCVVAPSRPSMCGHDWRDVETCALFGVGYFPYKRRADEVRPGRQVVDPGECLDEQRGEYAGVNRAVQELSHGKVERVYLHSVRDFPHTSCGCFRYLAFWIDEVGGVGVMHRDFTGQAPGGQTWNMLANRAGGKQSSGVTGVGPAYLPLPAFLRGDGGHSNVVWMTQKARDAAGPAATNIATEQEASTMEELAAYLEKAR
jgi:acetyl-CoA decarbonylase/synthase complex subunit beta